MVDNSGGSQEVELNLAPIIDCFTVLITYLLVTASFLTLAAVDVSVSANNDMSSTSPPVVDKKPPLVMTLNIEANNQISLKVSGGDLKKPYEVAIPPTANASWDQDRFEATLLKFKDRWGDLKEVSVSAASTIKYKELVNIINSAQKTLPKVYISAG